MEIVLAEGVQFDVAGSDIACELRQGRAAVVAGRHLGQQWLCPLVSVWGSGPCCAAIALAGIG
jgi:hypothetical protein